ncbi:hypothetical protein ACFXKW_21115 [Streptomyces sp. NPDC059193]|uniref:hypothetical protein n=1 Tax=Streptomyces sp. NPDC059193 TaxID=3346763 RepID=UPI0036AD0ABC
MEFPRWYAEGGGLDVRPAGADDPADSPLSGIVRVQLRETCPGGCGMTWVTEAHVETCAAWRFRSEQSPVRCRRCGSLLAAFEGDIGSGSRVATERDVQICGDCGVDEAVRDALGLAPIPYGEWPVRERLTWDDVRTVPGEGS